MIKAKAMHTPGPWGYDLNHTIATVDGCEWGESIAQLPVGTHKRPPTAEEGANARLIAAAPDLLLVAKAAADLLRKLGGTNHDPEYSALLEVIAKAEGKS